MFALVERLRQVLLGESRGEGADVVVHAGGGVVVVNDDFSERIKLKKIDAVGQVGFKAEDLESEGTKR